MGNLRSTSLMVTVVWLVCVVLVLVISFLAIRAARYKPRIPEGAKDIPTISGSKPFVHHLFAIEPDDTKFLYQLQGFTNILVTRGSSIYLLRSCRNPNVWCLQAIQ